MTTFDPWSEGNKPYPYGVYIPGTYSSSDTTNPFTSSAPGMQWLTNSGMVQGNTSPSNAGGGGNGTTLSGVWNWLTKPIGSGDNTTTALQLGATGILGGLGLMNQRKQFNASLDQARKQFEFSKGLSQANFINQGTNYLNQGLFQLEGLNAFNPEAAKERASNFNAAFIQMNDAASKIGLNGSFNQQQNQLSKYNQLQKGAMNG